MAKAPTAPKTEKTRAEMLQMGQGAPTPQPTEETSDGEAAQPEPVQPVSEPDGPGA